MKHTSRSLLAGVVKNKETVGCSVKPAIRVLDVVTDVLHVILRNCVEKTLQVRD